MLGDFRFAFRSLRRSPGFAAVAMLTLAIAIGACTAFFTVLHAVMLRPLPYSEPDTLVGVWSIDRAADENKPLLSADKAEFLLAQSGVFTEASLYFESAFTASISAANTPEQASGLYVADNFLSLLGLAPIRGRSLTKVDVQQNAPVALISESWWRTRFSGDEKIIGRTLLVDGNPREIVGVLPSLGAALGRVDLLVPFSMNAPSLSTIPIYLRKILPLYRMMARLPSKVAIDEANLRLEQAAREFRKLNPTAPDASNRNELRTFKGQLMGKLDRTFWTLAAAVVTVLLVACANVANLYLARLSARWNEVTIRIALGASRGAIARQFLAESLLFTAAAAAIGLILAWAGLLGMLALVGDQLPRAEEISLNTTAPLVAVCTALLCSLIVGFYPALRIVSADSRLEIARARVVGEQATGFFRSALVVSQVQLSIVLLSCAGLLIVSFYNLQTTDPGFATQGRAFGSVNLPVSRYGKAESAREFFRKIEAQLASAPELSAGGAASGLPLAGVPPSLPFALQDRPSKPAAERPTAAARIVTPGYFRAMGIRLTEGRFFTDRDHADSELVIIVNESLAKRLSPHESAVGKVVLVGNAGAGRGSRIVGVIRQVKSSALTEDNAGDEIYVPHAQPEFGFGAMTIVGQARPGLQAGAVIPVLRRALASVDSDLVLMDPQTVDGLVSQSLTAPRVTMKLLIGFSCVAVLLAAIGIYSVLAYNVSRRRAEIGIRMALGAQRSQVVTLVLFQGLRLVIIGLLLGLATAAATTRLLGTMLYRVQPLDPLVFGVMTVFFLIIALLACLVPSLIASRVNPLVALRAE